MEETMSKKNVVIMLGSPRKNGNSAILAQKTAEGIESSGAEYESFLIHDMNIKPCRACDKCQEAIDKYCVINDDMQVLYPKIVRSHALVIASPVYWFTVTAQTKLFMDRCYALGTSEEQYALKGKKIGIIMTYGDSDPYNSGAVNAFRTFQDAYSYIGAHLVGIVYGSALEAGEISANQEVMEKAFDLGKKLVQT
jgi:multimeric flavodoxin WrbA